MKLNPFSKPVKKTYVDFVAPLKGMMDDLTNYVLEQNQHIVEQEEAKAEIERDIANSEKEIQSSETTIRKLGELVV